MFSLLKSLFSSATSSFSVYLYAAIAVVFLSLSGGLYYYKTSFEKAIVDKATVEQQFAQAQTDLKTCSDNTEALKKESDIRSQASDVALAKAQANTKVVRVNVDRILQLTPSSPDSCASARELFNSYLSGSLTVPAKGDAK